MRVMTSIISWSPQLQNICYFYWILIILLNYLQLLDVDSNRDRDQEEELVNRALDLRAEGGTTGAGTGTGSGIAGGDAIEVATCPSGFWWLHCVCVCVCACVCVCMLASMPHSPAPFNLSFLPWAHLTSTIFLSLFHCPSLHPFFNLSPPLFQHHNIQSTCAYCGMTELDVCSPLVVGQCRSEHEAHLELLREAAEAEIAAAAAAVKGRYSPVVSTHNDCTPTIIFLSGVSLRSIDSILFSTLEIHFSLFICFP